MVRDRLNEALRYGTVVGEADAGFDKTRRTELTDAARSARRTGSRHHGTPVEPMDNPG